jgi:cytochrome c-type biogenesis protein CcmH/NrfG
MEMRPMEGGKNITINRGTSFSTSGGAGSQPPRPREHESQEKTGVKQTKITKILDVVISVSLVALFFGLPLFFTGRTYQGIAFEKQIYFYFWILLALVSWVTKGVIAGELKIKRTPLDIPILVFFLVYLISTIFSIDRWHSFWGFFGDPSRGFVCIIALIFTYYLLLSHLAEKPQKKIGLILGGLVLGNFIISLWTILAIFGIHFLPGKLAQFSPLSLIGSISGLGTYLGIMLPLLVVAVFKLSSNENISQRSRIIYNVVALITLVSDLFLLLAIYSFVSWIAVLVGVSFLIIYIISRIVRPAENWTWLPMAVFVAILVILMVNQVQIAKINLPVEVSPSYQLSWQIAKEAAKDKFIIGSGPATYGYDFSLHRPQDFNLNTFYNLRFYQGTGILSEALPTIGALGVIVLVFLVLAFLSVGIYLLSRDKEKNKIYSLGFFTATLIFIVSAFTTRIEGSVLVLGTLISILTIAVLNWESQSEEKNLNLSLKASPKFALALAFVFMVVSAGVVFLFVYLGKAYVADARAGSAVREQQITEDGSIKKLGEAITLNSREGRYYTRAAQEYMVLANNETLKGEKDRNLEAIQKYLNGSIAFAKKGADLMKGDVLSVEVLAQVYENAGLYVPDSLRLAEDTYKQAQSLEPHNPDYYLKLGQIKIAQASSKESKDEKKQLITEAKDLFQSSINEKNNYAPGYYQLSLTQEALEDLDQAIDNMSKAFAFDNSNINYAFNLGRLYQARGGKDDNTKAESLFKQILGVNDKEVNTHFSLGILYEKTGRKSDAVSEYQKVLELLPAESQNAKDQIQKMIDNIQNGISNLTNTSQNVNDNQLPAQPAQ